MFPSTKNDHLSEVMSGITISDPFRWLEDEKNSEVADWISVQNDYTSEALKTKSQAAYLNELEKDIRVASYSCPVVVGSKYFYTERQPDEDQAVLYVKTGLQGVPQKLVDTNGSEKGSTTTISDWFPSITGRYLVYGLYEGGDEMSNLYIKDVEKQQDLPYKIIHCRFTSLMWLPDDSGFFYTRNARPGSVPLDEEHLHSKVYLHKLGNDPADDELIFGQGRAKDDRLGLRLSIDGKLLGIHVSQGWTETDVYLYQTEDKTLRPLIVGQSAKFSLRFLPDKVLLHTNYQASNYRILASTLDQISASLNEWQEFVPETKDILQSVAVTSDKVILEYLANVCSKLIALSHLGAQIGEVPIPSFSSLSCISTRVAEKEFFYAYETFTTPKVVCRFNSETSEYEKYIEMDSQLDPDEYNVRQVWSTSQDGTLVPMFVVSKKDAKTTGHTPTLLLGYGGFGVSKTPTFLRIWIPWLERGGAIAISNIRGGGEFGDKWHKGGIQQYKHKGFEDFISAAEYLIANKVTDSEHLGIIGGSNVGLLVTAVAVMRPELFKAVCARVPLTDMVRFYKFGIAVRWIHEYGNPEVQADLEKILKWSPYHNVSDGVEYPNFLFTTASNDTRVNPLHSRKMVALLQSVNKKNKVFLYTEFEAGHGMGKPVSKILETQSLIMNFFAELLGL